MTKGSMIREKLDNLCLAAATASFGLHLVGHLIAKLYKVDHVL